MILFDITVQLLFLCGTVKGYYKMEWGPAFVGRTNPLLVTVTRLSVYVEAIDMYQIFSRNKWEMFGLPA